MLVSHDIHLIILGLSYSYFIHLNGLAVKAAMSVYAKIIFGS